MSETYDGMRQAKNWILRGPSTCPPISITVTVGAMNVTATEFRARLLHWLDCARSGEEVVITERGVRVARLSGIDPALTIERLTAQGVIARPMSTDRPKATGQWLPRPHSPESDLATEQRR